MAAHSPTRSLQETRLRVPARSERFVQRPRITQLLDEAVTGPVTVVTGPAGTGKSLAVADWTRAGRLPGPAAWVSLDRGDADPARFWASLVAALSLATGGDTLARLDVPDHPDVGFLGDVAAALGGHLVLLLDDVHELGGSAVLGWLDSLLRWPPDGVHVVLISRHDPPLALQRLRLEGRLADVRFADLAFTPEESADLLAAWGVRLTPDALRRLLETTGGWVAALRLAALTLRVADDPSQAIERFGGPTFLVSEYLWDEVLRLLPEELTEFLLRTSVATRICAPLAAELTGRRRADLLLRTLAAEELLVQELEGTGWYRTHSLMSEVLRTRLHADRPELERQLHVTAALWFEREGAWLEALRHAVASGQWEFAGQVAVRSGCVLWFGPDRAQYGDAFRDVPAGAVAEHPELAAAVALAAYCRLETTATRTLLARAEVAVDTLAEPRRAPARVVVCLVRAAQAQRDGDVPTMAAATAEADSLLAGLSGEQVPGWAQFRGALVAMRGVAELWSGRPEAARDLLVQAVTLHPTPGLNSHSAAYYRGLLALAEADAGSLAHARQTALASLEAARLQGRMRGHEAQWAWLALATVAVQTGDNSEAREALRSCEESAAERGSPFVVALAGIVAARRLVAIGDLGEARRALAAVESVVAQRAGMEAVGGMATSVRIDLEIAAGTPQRGLAALKAHEAALAAAPEGISPPSPDPVATARARLHLALGHPDRVRPAVAHLLDRPGVEPAKAWLVVALAEDRLRRDARSIEALARALDLAAEEGLFLAFARPTPALAGSLRRHLQVVGTHRDLVERALATASDGGAAPAQARPVEALTERESAVLTYLPTMGSNAEIAEALSISENTVKQHLKSIYRKLGVSSRRDAVRVGREQGFVRWGVPAGS